MTQLSRVVAVLERAFPTRFAAKWDNVGLLIDAAQAAEVGVPYTVLFTNDLTPAVLAESIALRVRLIVSYHPTPFAAQKKLTLEPRDVPGQIILGCAANGIAVYAPHTGWDAAADGLNTWMVSELARLAGQTLIGIIPVKLAAEADAAALNCGDGRVGTLASAATVADVVEAAKQVFGLANVQLALPTRLQVQVVEARGGGAAAVLELARSLSVSSIAVCAGSGSGVLPGSSADVYVTGEMGHHEVLAATHAGRCVILTGHSNCERGFLPVVMARLRPLMADAGLNVELLQSSVDADPLYIV
jgi:dinuclear metal center YbgI/SA1388 family protein